ncbi:MAG: sulfotransferase family 2 domain-containing protein [Alphaproteobacteria bacterium GM7ARS4]|nr:sulfotransferase family 2 domain-containing protein [Alphaproteobacteria bacterium GM7ARS4]
MIISYHRQFIFIKTVKVAGSSLEFALCQHCGAHDIFFPEAALREQLPPPSQRTRTRPPDVQHKHMFHQRVGHTPAKEIARVLGDDLFRRFLKISVTRNPFDTVVSHYAWLRRSEGEAYLMVRDNFIEWFWQHRCHVLHYNRRLCTLVEPYDAVDFMVRYESLERDLHRLSLRLGLAENLYRVFMHIKEKGHFRPRGLTARHCFEDFDDGIVSVKRHAAVECARFGYDVPF